MPNYFRQNANGTRHIMSATSIEDAIKSGSLTNPAFARDGDVILSIVNGAGGWDHPKLEGFIEQEPDRSENIPIKVGDILTDSSGCQVRIICTDRRGNLPIVGLRMKESWESAWYYNELGDSRIGPNLLLKIRIIPGTPKFVPYQRKRSELK